MQLGRLPLYQLSYSRSSDLRVGQGPLAVVVLHTVAHFRISESEGFAVGP
jgi:hypothetical protein